MYKIILFFIVSIFFISCSKPIPPSPSQKTFADEDTYIVFALRAEEVGSFNTAGKLFEKLYVKSQKKEYLYRSLSNYMSASEFDKVIKKVDYYNEKETDIKLLRFKVLALLHKKQYNKAKDLALKLVKLTSASEDYLLTAQTYLKLKNYKMAIKYLDSAYHKEYNPTILDQISIILYMNLQDPKEAIARLETHLRMFGCNEIICQRLLSFYSKQNNVDGMLSVYKKFYKMTKNEAVLEKILQIYIYKKDYFGLKEFLEQSGANDEMLLELYASQKELKKASKIAYKLYDKTLDIKYLAQGSIYEFESLKKKDKKTLKKIINNLKKVIQEDNSALYLNYLGYIMIDENIDIKEGMEYIKKALKQKPKSAYYLDSLAWGYYKLGKCKKSYRLFKKIKKLEGGNDPEITKHIKVVKKCLNKKNKRKK